MSDIEAQDWYLSLVDDCKAIITEAVHNSRWELIVGYHTLGGRIVTDDSFQKYAKGNQVACNTLANNLDMSPRSVYYAIQFFETYPDLTLLPDGKNISWNKIVNNLLPDRTPDALSPVPPSVGRGIFERLLSFANQSKFDAAKTTRYSAWVEAGKEFFE